MTKSLQILLGLVLILILAYVAFLDVSAKIKNDLLTKAKVIFTENNIKELKVAMQGEGLSMSRTLVLTGRAISELERSRIVTLTQNIEGVCSIANKIELYPTVPKTPLVPEVPEVIAVPSVKISSKKSIAKEIPKKELMVETLLTKESIPLVSPTKSETKIPPVPVAVSKSIVVPIPVKAIDAPKVIKIEKIKLEGVK